MRDALASSDRALARRRIVQTINALPDEGFAWLMRALLPPLLRSDTIDPAKRPAIEELRDAAREYLRV